MVELKNFALFKYILDIIEIPTFICGIIMSIVFRVAENYILLNKLYEIGFIVLIVELGLKILANRLYVWKFRKLTEKFNEEQ